MADDLLPNVIGENRDNGLGQRMPLHIIIQRQYAVCSIMDTAAHLTDYALLILPEQITDVIVKLSIPTTHPSVGINDPKR